MPSAPFGNLGCPASSASRSRGQPPSNISIFHLHARSQTNIQTTPQTTIKEIGNMTTIPFNETRTCIEDALASAGYAEKMISLADQYRREGNHAAANAALMMTWNIRANIAKAIEVLPMLTPEHARLLDQSERQRLVTELATSSANLERRLQEHPVTVGQLNDCDEQEAGWYMSCLHIGHLAHLARNISERAARSPDDDELAEVMAFAINACYEDARQSIQDIPGKQPSADTVFPQTHSQAMDQARVDHAELETLNQQFTEKLERPCGPRPLTRRDGATCAATPSWPTTPGPTSRPASCRRSRRSTSSKTWTNATRGAVPS